MEEFNADKLIADTVTPIQELQIDIRQKNPIDGSLGRLPEPTMDLGMLGGGINNKTEKATLSREVPITEGYDLVAGDWMKKFPTYKQGRDNYEYAGQNQTTTDKWVNGAEKAILKTGNAVLGGTVGIVYGLGAALNEGSFSALYDNDFSNKLADWDEKLNYQLPNYYTKQENNSGIFGQMGYANFWADKFLGGLSFTAGAIVSEAIWAYATGGTSLATLGARGATRWGLRGLGEAGTIAGVAKNKAFLNSMVGKAYQTGKISKTAAINIARTGEALSTAGFMMRSAGYEASVEALQFKREAEENFYSNFEAQNNRQPTPEEVTEFEKNNVQAANAVFGSNMAILGVSNLAMFGNTFGYKNPIKTGINDFINKKAFGYGVEKASDGAYKALTATGKQKFARGVFDYVVKPASTEGLFEEGLQGVTTKMANKWIENSYDKGRTNETFTQMESFWQSIEEQYGSEEGWKDNMLGMLIGIAGGAVNVRGEQKAKQAEFDYQSAVMNTYDKDTLQSMVIPFRVQSANRMSAFSEEAKQEEQKGNIFKTKQAQESAKVTYINSELVMGSSISEITDKISNSLNSVSEEQWIESGIAKEDIDQHKSETLQDFKDLANEYKTNKQYFQYLFGKKLVGEQNFEETNLEKVLGSNFSKNAQLVEAFAWQATMGERANGMMSDVKNTVSKEIGQENADTMTTISKLKEVGEIQNANLNTLQKEYAQSLKERDALVKKITKLQSAPKETTAEGAQKTPYREAELRLLEVEETLSKIEAEAAAISEKIVNTERYKQSIENVNTSTNLSTATITGTDLLNLNKNIEKFKSAIDYLKETNPQRHQYLVDLLDEYGQAQDMFLNTQKTIRTLASPNVKMENIGGWISAKLKNKKAMDEDTQTWMQNALNEYANAQKATIESNLESQEVVPPTEDSKKDLKSKEENVKITSPKSDLEIYKQKIENLLKNVYRSLSHLPTASEDLLETKPTKKDIEDYRTLNKNSKEFKKVQSKLQNWKLLATAVDEDYTSIAELLDVIEQLETEVAEKETKDEVTTEEILTSFEGTGSVFDPTLTINTNATATVKINEGAQTLQLTHIKARYIVEQIGTEYTIKGKGKDIDNLKVGDIVTIDNISFTYLSGGRLEFKTGEFSARQQQLNLYLIDTKTVKWSFPDMYSVVNNEWVKTPSQFTDNLIDAQKSYNVQKGDKLTLHIDNVDGWNDTKEGSNKEQLKIYLKDSSGNYISTLRGLGEVNEKTDPVFLNIRERAFEVWDSNGRPSKMDLGIEVEADNLFFGSLELVMEDGQPIETDISKNASQKVIISKGYIQDGELTLDTETKDVNTAYVGKISKNNPGKKQPIVIVRKGSYNIALPITMRKTPSPLNFEGLLVGSTQEMVLKINEEALNNGIKSDLVFEDITQDSDGNITLSPKAEAVKELFNNHTTFVDADTVASKKYKRDNLTKDATIRVDLDNMDRVFASPKLRIKLDESVVIKTEVEVKNNTLIEIENELNSIAIELYKDYVSNASTKYLDSNGDIIEDTTYTDAFDNNEITEANSQIQKMANIKVLREALSTKTPKKLTDIIGKDKITQAEKLLNQYDFVKSQLVVKNEDVANGTKNICN